MSDQTDGDNSAPSPGSEHQIPKYRLDQEINARRNVERELATLKDLLPRIMQGQQQPAPAQPEKEDPELVELAERDPIAAKRFKALQAQNKRLSAGLFQQNEEFDRAKFINQVGGDEAQRLGPKVEQTLEAMRQRGNFSMNRTDIYLYMRGQETLNKDRQPKQPKPQGDAPPAGQQPPAQHHHDASGDVPGDDPSAAGVTPKGAALGNSGQPSLEELEAKLANQIL